MTKIAITMDHRLMIN